MANTRLPELKKAIESYQNITKRRVSFEYALMKGINDSEDELEALIMFCKNIISHVNLIPLNSIEKSVFKPSGHATLKHWQTTLSSKGIETTVRHSRGSDICGACGQLKNSVATQKR